MEPVSNATVYIVDDDAGVREALAWMLRSRRLPSEAFESAQAFDDMLQSRTDPRQQPCCVLLDVRMPGLSGLALFERMAVRGDLDTMPVIFLTGHADVPTAVDTVKRGAFDFCEKPFSDNALVDRIEQALARSAERLAELRERAGALWPAAGPRRRPCAGPPHRHRYAAPGPRPGRRRGGGARQRGPAALYPRSSGANHR